MWPTSQFRFLLPRATQISVPGAQRADLRDSGTCLSNEAAGTFRNLRDLISISMEMERSDRNVGNPDRDAEPCYQVMSQ